MAESAQTEHYASGLQRLLPTRIGNRLLVAFVGLVFLLTGALLSHFILFTRSILDGEQEYQGHALAESVAQSSELGILTGEDFFLEAPFAVAMENPTTLFIAAYDRRGELIAQRSRTSIEPQLSQERTAELLALPSPPESERIILPMSREKADVFFAPVVVEEVDETLTEELLETPGQRAAARRSIGLIQLGLSRERIATLQLQSMSVAILTTIVALAIGIVVAIFLSRRITRPLQQLEEGTRHIAKGDLDVILPVESQDEVGALARSFNSMVQALRDTTVSRDYFDWILRSLVDVLLVTDDEGRITLVNEAAGSTFGCSEDTLIGKSIETLFADDERHFDDAVWKPLLANGRLVQHETKGLRADGSSFAVAISGATLKGKAHGGIEIVLIARDITEKKQAEEAVADKLRYIQKINTLMVGREMRVIEIKEEVNSLLEELGRSRKYLS